LVLQTTTITTTAGAPGAFEACSKCHYLQRQEMPYTQHPISIPQQSQETLEHERAQAAEEHRRLLQLLAHAKEEAERFVGYIMRAEKQAAVEQHARLRLEQDLMTSEEARRKLQAEKEVRTLPSPLCYFLPQSFASIV
jgi:hypothetical protein